jgi:hypothetical protein
VTRTLLLFVGSLTGLWMVTGLPAWWIWGEAGLIDSAIALGLCAVPMMATLAWGQWSRDQSPSAQLAAAMGGTGIRMAAVVVLGIVLYSNVPMLNHAGFLLAVVGYYLATLTIEVVILVSGKPKSQTSGS